MSVNNYRSSGYYPYGNNNVFNSYNQGGYTPTGMPNLGVGMGGYMPQNPQQIQNPNQQQMNGFNGQQMGQMPQMSPYNSIPIKTNKIFVTGVEEAINRSTEYNSETIFFHQDFPVIYEVIVDGKGRKEVFTYNVTPQNNSQQNNSEENKQTENTEQKIDLSKYVKVTEFNELFANFTKLNERFERLLSQLRGNSQPKPKNPQNTQNTQDLDGENNNG